MTKIISTEQSNIEHVIIDGQLKHVQYLTVTKANDEVPPSFKDFTLINSSNRKIIRGEFDGYYEGRLYTFVYRQILD